MASGLGILIVFAILVLLSGLMILIRKLSDSEPREKKPAAAKPAPARKKKAGEPTLPLPVLVAAAAQATAAGSPDWIAAAVAAVIAVEDDEAAAPSAVSWNATAYTSYDPWVANTKLSKTVPGV